MLWRLFKVLWAITWGSPKRKLHDLIHECVSVFLTHCPGAPNMQTTVRNSIIVELLNSLVQVVSWIRLCRWGEKASVVQTKRDFFNTFFSFSYRQFCPRIRTGNWETKQVRYSVLHSRVWEHCWPVTLSRFSHCYLPILRTVLIMCNMPDSVSVVEEGGRRHNFKTLEDLISHYTDTLLKPFVSELDRKSYVRHS